MTRSLPRSHSFIVRHVLLKAQTGNPIAPVKDGDIICVDGFKNTLSLDASPEEMAKRKAE